MCNRTIFFSLLLVLPAISVASNEVPKTARYVNGTIIEDFCQPGGSRIIGPSPDKPLGEIRYKFEKIGQKVVGYGVQYRISHSGSGSKANVNIGMRLWNNAAGTGASTVTGNVNSPDAMKQDGVWHDLGLKIDKDVGFDVKRAGLSTQFIFDISGADSSCWIIHADKQVVF